MGNMNEVGGLTAGITSAALFVIGLVVIWPTHRRVRVPGVQFFALLCFSLAAWVMSNMLSDIDVSRAIFWIRVSFASISVGLFSFLMFVNRFPASRYISSTENILHGGALALILPIIFSNQFIPSIVFRDGISNVIPGILYPVFLAYVAYALGVALIRLYLSYRRLHGHRRTQVLYILNGVGLMAAVAVMTNLVLPLILGNNDLYWIGSTASLLFIGAIAYSIARYRLFDIKRAVMRALAYVLVVITLLAVYSLTVFAGLARLAGLDAVPVRYQLLLLAIAAVIGFTIPPLVRFFDKITQKIFLRRTYNPQQVLAMLGVAIEDRTSLAPFINEALDLLENALKPEFVVLAIRKNKSEVKLYRRGETNVDEEVVMKLMSSSESVIIGEVNDSALRKVMDKNDIGVSVSLNTSRSRFGCFILGYKQNGNSYTDTDRDFLELFSDELGLALQNLLRLQEIRDFNETLQSKVNDATAQLRQSNKKLHVLDEAKDEFISMASHQLRTPLTSVKGYLSMVLDGDMGKVTPEQRKVLEEAFNSSQRMVYLISDFLNVSRIQTGKFELERTQTNLADVLADEIEQLRVMASSRQVKIEYDQPSNFPIAFIDQDKFRQVMMNFIDNAIYYSNPNTTITISLTKEVNDIVFKVMDQGIGVPASERHRLFTKFYRATNAKKQRPDGTGIGLFMAQKVIVAHGGSIVFESRENQGSTFGFRLPLKDNSK